MQGHVQRERFNGGLHRVVTVGNGLAAAPGAAAAGAPTCTVSGVPRTSKADLDAVRRIAGAAPPCAVLMSAKVGRVATDSKTVILMNGRPEAAGSRRFAFSAKCRYLL